MSEQLLWCRHCETGYPDEEFCPKHGERLHARVQAEPPTAPLPSPAPPADAHTATPDPAPAATGSAATTPAPERPASLPMRTKLATFMARYGLRAASTEPQIPEATTAPASSLPPEVLAMGWRETAPVESSASFDFWSVSRTDPDGRTVHGQFRRLRTGALTKHVLYQQIEDQPPPRLARLWQHGTYDNSGARADMELVSLPRPGQSLQSWFKASSPSDERGLHVARLSADLLEQLRTAGVQPLALEPSWLHMTDDDELWLALAAALTHPAATRGYYPEFERSSLLAPTWSAPELKQSLLSDKAVLYSVGQLLMVATLGQPCSPAEVEGGAVPLGQIRDARLARLVMGCLYPRADERWSVAEFHAAARTEDVTTMPPAPPWSSLMPGAASNAWVVTGGHSYWRLEDLLQDLVTPAQWDACTQRLPQLLEWIELTAWACEVTALRHAIAQGRSADWVLVSLCSTVLPDRPRNWRGLDFSDGVAQASLVGLAQSALEPAAQEQANLLRQLFAADLRGAFRSPRHPTTIHS